MFDSKSMIYLMLYYFISGIIFVFGIFASCSGHSDINGTIHYSIFIIIMILSIGLNVVCISKMKSYHKILVFTFGISLILGVSNLLGGYSFMFGSLTKNFPFILLSYPSMSFSNCIGEIFDYCSTKPAYMWESSKWALCSNVGQIVFCISMLSLCFKKSISK